jgi:entericidin A
MKKITLTVLMLVALVTLNACNTMEGFGQDVKKVGEKIEGAAAKK